MKRLMLAALVMVCLSCATAPKAMEPIATAGIECLAAARERTDVEACVMRVAMEAHQAVCVNAAPMLAVGASRAIQAAIDAWVLQIGRVRPLNPSQCKRMGC